MPNPTDASRARKSALDRARGLWDSSHPDASTKKSWSEWLMGDGFLAQTAVGTGTSVAGSATDAAVGGMADIAAEKAAKVALLAALQMMTGTWVATAGGVVGAAAYEVVQNKLDEKFKLSEKVKNAANSGYEAVQRYRYGGNAAATKLLTRETQDDMTLDDAIQSFRENSAFLQDVLNRLAGKAGAAYYCDDAYQLAAIAQKSAGVKASLEADIKRLKAFLEDMETELHKFDPPEIQKKAMDVVEAICNAGDGRHWDNSWTATAMAFRRCSRQHCYGPA